MAQLFATKSLAPAARRRWPARTGSRRVLGPVQLTSARHRRDHRRRHLRRHRRRRAQRRRPGADALVRRRRRHLRLRRAVLRRVRLDGARRRLAPTPTPTRRSASSSPGSSAGTSSSSTRSARRPWRTAGRATSRACCAKFGVQLPAALARSADRSTTPRPGDFVATGGRDRTCRRSSSSPSSRRSWSRASRRARASTRPWCASRSPPCCS